jgi:hypothetical protein
MKKLKTSYILATMAITLTIFSCGTTNDTGGNGGSDSTAGAITNDSASNESRKAMGIGEDNQNEVPGYPANQSNLNADSTRAKH